MAHVEGGERVTPFSPGGISPTGSDLLGRERFPSRRLLGLPLAILLTAACASSTPTPPPTETPSPVRPTVTPIPIDGVDSSVCDPQGIIFGKDGKPSPSLTEKIINEFNACVLANKTSAEATATEEAKKPTPTPEKRLTQEEAVASINSIISQVKNPDFASLGITEAPQKEGGQIVYVKKGPNEEIIYKTRSGNVEGNMLKLLNGMPEDKEFRIPKIPGYLEIREDLQAGRTAEAKAKLIILLQNSLVSNSLSIEPPTGDRLTLFPTAEDVKKVDPNGEYGLKRFTRISEVRKPVFDATLKLLGEL